mgnify:CR=1 FL=1
MRNLLLSSLLLLLVWSCKNTKQIDKTIFIYAGGLTKIRGIKEICEAIELVDENIELKLLGVWESENFKEICLTGKTKVTYLGVTPLDKVYPILKSADVGIVTLYKEKNYLNSIPIKAFEYMACKLPILMSDIPYWENLFSECSVDFFFQFTFSQYLNKG